MLALDTFISSPEFRSISENTEGAYLRPTNQTNRWVEVVVDAVFDVT